MAKQLTAAGRDGSSPFLSLCEIPELLPSCCHLSLLVSFS